MISLCMIVKNEEAVIGRCLDSVKNLVEEINIVDTGSTDRTKEIVADYTDRIYDFEWVDDFAAARNFSFEKATQDYILWLDADDVLAEKDAEKLLALKKTLDPSVDAVAMDYHLAFDEDGNVTFHIQRNRLVKRERQFRWIGPVHEYLEVGGNMIQSDVAVTHHPLSRDSDRNLRIYEERLERGETFTPRDLFYFANELADHFMHEQAISYYEKFLATDKGWIEDKITACSKLADCYFQLGQPEKELQATFRSFIYDRPRPELCCRLGYHFFNRNALKTAVFWYTLATQQSESTMGLVNKACSTWLPHLQLCVCYSRLGDHELAYLHNEKARQYRPTDANVLHNKHYLEGMKQKKFKVT